MSHLLAIRQVVERVSFKTLSNSCILRRNLLSAAYACEDSWKSQRKQCETLKHITPERYFFELNQKYQQKHSVSPIDVDIYINSIFKSENQDELEHMIKRFRTTKLTVNTLDSTHHAVCRFYLHNHKLERLFHVLNNRLEFGIFPDVFCYNMLLDACLKENSIESAFELIKLMMLQEDSGNRISKILVLHTLQKMLESGFFAPKEAAEATEEATEEAAEDDDEVEYIRVPYLTNPYFDDHFDLTDKKKIFGKSLYFFGSELEQSVNSEEEKNLAQNCQLMGLIAFEKFDKIKSLLARMSNVQLLPETVQLADQKLEELANKTEESDENLNSLAKDVLAQLKKRSSSSTSFKAAVEKLVGELPSLESGDIQQQKNTFAEFEKTRVEGIQRQLDAILHQQKAADLEQKKQDLEQKKRLYYFFENFAKHEIDFVEAEKRIKEIQSKTVVDEDYIPPERR